MDASRLPPLPKSLHGLAISDHRISSLRSELKMVGGMEILKVDTKEQKADIVTKAMDGPTLKTIRRILQGW